MAFFLGTHLALNDFLSIPSFPYHRPKRMWTLYTSFLKGAFFRLHVWGLNLVSLMLGSLIVRMASLEYIKLEWSCGLEFVTGIKSTKIN